MVYHLGVDPAGELRNTSLKRNEPLRQVAWRAVQESVQLYRRNDRSWCIVAHAMKGRVFPFGVGESNDSACNGAMPH